MSTYRRSAAKHKPLQLVSSITDNDVLFGRGTGTYDHKGNIKFRALVKQKLAEYRQAGGVHGQKTRVAFAVVKQVIERKGRFLRAAEPSEVRRYLLSNNMAKFRISHFDTGRDVHAVADDGGGSVDDVERDCRPIAGVGSRSRSSRTYDVGPTVATSDYPSQQGSNSERAIGTGAGDDKTQPVGEHVTGRPKMYAVITDRTALILKSKQAFRHAVNSAKTDHEYDDVSTTAPTATAAALSSTQHAARPSPVQGQALQNQALPTQFSMPTLCLPPLANPLMASLADLSSVQPRLGPLAQQTSASATETISAAAPDLPSTLSSIQALLLVISIQLSQQPQEGGISQLAALLQPLYAQTVRLTSIVEDLCSRTAPSGVSMPASAPLGSFAAAQSTTADTLTANGQAQKETLRPPPNPRESHTDDAQSTRRSTALLAALRRQGGTEDLSRLNCASIKEARPSAEGCKEYNRRPVVHGQHTNNQLNPHYAQLVTRSAVAPVQTQATDVRTTMVPMMPNGRSKAASHSGDETGRRILHVNSRASVTARAVSTEGGSAPAAGNDSNPQPPSVITAPTIEQLMAALSRSGNAALPAPAAASSPQSECPVVAAASLKPPASPLSDLVQPQKQTDRIPASSTGVYASQSTLAYLQNAVGVEMSQQQQQQQQQEALMMDLLEYIRGPNRS